MGDKREELTEGQEFKKCVVVHHCSQEEHIGEMMALMKRLVQQVYGNGQKGLAFTVPELGVRIDSLAADIKDLSTNVSALMRFEAETAGEHKAGDKHGLSSRAWAGIIISAVLGVSAIVITLFQIYLRMHKII
jgi:hypothetical protein